jgi:ABC-2 type transport system permease protein
MSSTLATQVFTLARRSIVRTLRQPATAIPPLVFPLVLLAVNTSGLDVATRIPGFPTNSYLDFALAFAFLQGAMFSTMNAGTDLARDIQTGFLNRLALTPMRGAALIAGHLGGVVVLGLVQAGAYLTVGLIAGASVKAGVLGALVIFGLYFLIVLGFGAVGIFMALRTGSGEAVQGLFPVLFVLLFLSSMSMPRNLIEIGWFRTVATINPVSYLVEGVRSLIILGWDGEALALAFGVALAIVALGLSAASLALNTRLVRT